jgi:hypothetical protein
MAVATSTMLEAIPVKMLRGRQLKFEVTEKTNL